MIIKQNLQSVRNYSQARVLLKDIIYIVLPTTQVQKSTGVAIHTCSCLLMDT